MSKFFRQAFSISLFGTFIIVGCTHPTINKPISKKEALYSFAKLYGNVKYYCPSDEAAQIDWDAFALYGTRKILALEDESQFAPLMEELFSPIVPEFKIINSNGNSPIFSTAKSNLDTSSILTSWQHFGHGDGSSSKYYKSIRTNRQEDTYVKDKSGFSYLIATSKPFEADSVEVSFDIKHLHKSLRTYTSVFLGLKYENSSNVKYQRLNRYSGSEWKNLKVKSALDNPISEVTIVTSFNDKGTLLIDNLNTSIFKKGSWLEYDSTSFEEIAKDFLSRKNTNKLYIEEIKRENDSSTNFLYTTRLVNNQKTSKQLYDVDSKYGETLTGDLNDTQNYQFPTVLLIDSLVTSPGTDEIKFEELRNKLNKIHSEKYDIRSIDSKVANFITLWNVFKHFYPYSDEMDIEWGNEFSKTLNIDKVKDTKHINLLRNLVSKLKDGHGDVTGLINYNSIKFLPFDFKVIDGEAIVEKVDFDSLSIFKGSTLFAVNDTLFNDYIKSVTDIYSASKHTTLIYKIIRDISRSYDDSNKKLTFTLLNGKKVDLTTKDFINSDQYSLITNKPDSDLNHKINNQEIGYLNYQTLNKQYFLKNYSEIFQKPVLIIDSRENLPFDVIGLLQYFLCSSDSTKWLFVPKFHDSNTRKNNEYKELGWKYSPEENCYKGQIFYLTNSISMSYRESIAAYFKKLRNATIVGQPTAGTNGDVNRTYLPGGFTVKWTGTKVLKHDGSQLHGIGITPDVYVERTPEGIAAGRDEVLEKAIELATKHIETTDN